MQVTSKIVQNAYAALASGDRERIQEYWADDMTWQVPGHNVLSGWKNSLDEFLKFMANVGELSNNSFQMERSVIMVDGEYSADVSRNIGNRAGDNDEVLNINVIHLLQWRDGKVIKGQGAIFGNGTSEYDKFWSPV